MAALCGQVPVLGFCLLFVFPFFCGRDAAVRFLESRLPLNVWKAVGIIDRRLLMLKFMKKTVFQRLVVIRGLGCRSMAKQLLSMYVLPSSVLGTVKQTQ